MRWEKRTLEELTASTRPICYGVLKPGDFIDDGIPLVRVTDISKNHFNSTSLYRISASLDEEFARSRLEGGEILLSIQGTVGRVAIAPPEMKGANISRTIAIISPDDRVNRRYLYHYLRKLGDASGFYISGTTRASLNITELRSIEIPLPPLEEQRRIAAILDGVDELRRKRQRALDWLNRLGQAIFIEMFGDLLLSKDQAVALGEVCDVRDGTHDSPRYVDAGFPLLTSKNFSGGRIDYTGAKLIAEGDFANINKRSKVDKGDIVMPMIGTIGGPVIVDFDPDFAIKNVALIKFANSPMNPEFIREALDSRLFRSHVASLGRGGTQKFVSLGDIRCFKIPFPSVSQQNLFAKRLRALRAERARHGGALTISETLLSSLQHRALSGDLKVFSAKEAAS